MSSAKGRTPKERRIRSRLHQLVRGQGVLHASLLTLKTKCGKPSCRCAKGEEHEAVVVEQSKQGKTRMRTVPPQLREEISAWVENWKEAQELWEELSELHWDKLADQKKKD
jgi:gas vesicle protein